MPDGEELDLDAKLQWLLRRMNGSGIPYAIGGALALGYYAEHPRATDDVDMNVFLPVERSQAVLDVLTPRILATRDQHKELERDGQARLWWGTTPIDVFFMNIALHDEMARARVLREYAGIPMPILSVTHLVTCKAIFNRTKDWPDIDTVLDHPDLDRDAVTGWLVRICGEGSDQLLTWLETSEQPAARMQDEV